MEELLSNFNGWTIAGIICAFLTYFFIQKGTIVNATKNKNELKTEIDSVQTEAIKAINTTTENTIEKIKLSSDLIIKDLEDKSASLGNALVQLETKTQIQTQQINTNTQIQSVKTQELVTSESSTTRKEVKSSKDETIEAVKSIDPSATGLTYVIQNLDKLIKNNEQSDWDKWNKTSKEAAQIFIKTELGKLSPKEKGYLLNYLIKTKLIGSQEDLYREGRKFKGDRKEIEMRRYWPYVPVNLAYHDFSNTYIENQVYGTGLFLTFMNFDKLKIKDYLRINDSFLSATTFRHCKIQNAIISNCDLRLSNWENGDLRNVNFSNSNLVSAAFSYWNLGMEKGKIYKSTQANLQGVDFTNSILTGAIISNEQLKQAKSLKNATMPNGKKYNPDLSIEEQNLKYVLITKE